MSNRSRKKAVASLYLSDEDLGTIYFLFSDEINYLRDFCSNLKNNPDDLAGAAKQLRNLIPIQQKLEKYFSDCHIKFRSSDEDNDLALYGIDTNL